MDLHLLKGRIKERSCRRSIISCIKASNQEHRAIMDLNTIKEPKLDLLRIFRTTELLNKIRHNNNLINDYSLNKPLHLSKIEEDWINHNRSLRVENLYNNTVRTWKFKTKFQLSQIGVKTPVVNMHSPEIKLTLESQCQNKENCGTMKRFQRQLFTKQSSTSFFDPFKLMKNQSLNQVDSEEHESSNIENTLLEHETSIDSGNVVIQYPANRSNILKRSLSSFYEHEIKEKYTNDKSIAHVKPEFSCK